MKIVLDVFGSNEVQKVRKVKELEKIGEVVFTQASFILSFDLLWVCKCVCVCVSVCKRWRERKREKKRERERESVLTDVKTILDKNTSRTRINIRTKTKKNLQKKSKN